MKKILAVILSLSLSAFLLAGCGDGDVYERPGTGTTLSPEKSTAAPEPEADGSYSADPDGDVNDTTGEGMVEDGLDKVESGVGQGMEELGDGISDLGEDVSDMGGEDGAESSNADVGKTDNGSTHGSTNGNSH